MWFQILYQYDICIGLWLIQCGELERKVVVGFLLKVDGWNGNAVKGALGIRDETQLNSTVDAACHSIFEREIGNGQHGVIYGWKIRYKEHSDEDDAEPNSHA